MEDKTRVLPPFGSKSILRSTNEEVEIIDFNLPNRGMRTEPNPMFKEEGDWVTYIDSEGKEHIREHLNIQLDFKPVFTDAWNTMFDWAKHNKIPTTRNCRIFEVAKELYLNGNRGYGINEAVEVATNLVDAVGIETE